MLNVNTRAERYYNKIAELTSLDVKGVHWFYSVIVKGVKAKEVTKYSITKDYVNGYTANRVIEISIMKEDYVRYIYPSRNNLGVEVTITQVPERENGMKLNRPIIDKMLYRGVLVNPIDLTNNSNLHVNSQSPELKDGDKEYIRIEIQLVEIIADQLKSFTFGGIFNGIPGEVMRGLLTETVKQARITGYEVKGIEHVPWKMTKKKTDILIPHDTPVIDLPRLFQGDYYGLYDKGVGSFIHDKWWWIYSLYDDGRYDGERTKLTLSILPKGNMLDNYRTYHVSGREVNVISAGGSQVSDNTNERARNEGDGVTYFESNSFHHECVKFDAAKNIYIDTKPMKKTVQFGSGTRDDGLARAPFVDGNVMHNEMVAKSDVNRKGMIILHAVWEHANPELLVPGMPTKLIWYKNDDRFEVKGILLQQQAVITPGGNTNYKRHHCRVLLDIAIDKTKITINGKSTASSGGGSSGNLGGLIDKVLSIFK